MTFLHRYFFGWKKDSFTLGCDSWGLGSWGESIINTLFIRVDLILSFGDGFDWFWLKDIEFFLKSLILSFKEEVDILQCFELGSLWFGLGIGKARKLRGWGSATDWKGHGKCIDSWCADLELSRVEIDFLVFHGGRSLHCAYYFLIWIIVIIVKRSKNKWSTKIDRIMDIVHNILVRKLDIIICLLMNQKLKGRNGSALFEYGRDSLSMYGL